jgi:hypothetical protein
MDIKIIQSAALVLIVFGLVFGLFFADNGMTGLSVGTSIHRSHPMIIRDSESAINSIGLCHDSDNGKNFPQYGMTYLGTYSEQSGPVVFSGKIMYDSCSGNTLTEYYCSGTVVASALHVCANGETCVSGACMPSIPVKSFCQTPVVDGEFHTVVQVSPTDLIGTCNPQYAPAGFGQADCECVVSNNPQTAKWMNCQKSYTTECGVACDARDEAVKYEAGCGCYSSVPSGNNYLLGFTTDGVQTVYNNCNGNSVRSFYCLGNEVASNILPCNAGTECKDGICK